MHHSIILLLRNFLSEGFSGQLCANDSGWSCEGGMHAVVTGAPSAAARGQPLTRAGYTDLPSIELACYGLLP